MNIIPFVIIIINMSNHHPLKDTQTARAYFWRRLYEYGANNLQFTIYYDKVFRKEYLPSRIRYNQFFFYSIFIYFLYNLHHKVSYTYAK